MSQSVPPPLSRPVRELVGDALDQEAIDRGFRTIARRRAAKPSLRARRSFAFVAVAAAVAACFALFFALRAPGSAGPLARVDGAPFDAIEAAAAGAAVRAVLSDGSEIEVAPGGRVVTVGNDGGRVIAMLERGQATVHVQKGGPRAWTFECGLATVEVVGTRFVLNRSGDALRVEVTEGVVLVRGDHVPDRARRVVAGESIEVRGTTAAAPSAAPGPALDPVPMPAPSASASSAAPTPSASSSAASGTGWRDLAKSGDYRKAYDALGDGGVGAIAASSGVDDLFVLADVARLSGHPGEAVGPLERIVREHAGDGRAALAALTLARLRLDSLGQAGRAAADFETALALGLPAALQDDAMGRAVEARFRSGDQEGGRRTGERYLARFPNGRHAPAVHKLLGDPF